MKRNRYSFWIAPDSSATPRRPLAPSPKEGPHDPITTEGVGVPYPPSSDSASNSLRRASIRFYQVASSACGIGPAEAATSWRCLDLS